MKPHGKQSSEDAAKLFSSQLVPVDTVDTKNSTSLQEREGHHKGWGSMKQTLGTVG